MVGTLIFVVSTASGGEPVPALDTLVADGERILQRVHRVSDAFPEVKSDRAAMEASLADLLPLVTSAQTLSSRWTTAKGQAPKGTDLDAYQLKYEAVMDPANTMMSDLLVRGLAPRISEARTALDSAKKPTDPGITTSAGLLQGVWDVLEPAGPLGPPVSWDESSAIAFDLATRVGDDEGLSQWATACVEHCDPPMRARSKVELATVAVARKDKAGAASMCQEASKGEMDASLMGRCDKLLGKAWRP